MKALNIVKGTYSRVDRRVSCLVECRTGKFGTKREVWVSKHDNDPEFYTDKFKVVGGVKKLLAETGYEKEKTERS